ncbi:ATP-binding protein, partial [Streptomyces sp. W16]|nr:ATP-binding protein [Streptomyces sp. W16]
MSVSPQSSPPSSQPCESRVPPQAQPPEAVLPRPSPAAPGRVEAHPDRPHLTELRLSAFATHRGAGF